MMTKRDSLNAQGCLCMERDMPNRCLKRSYLRGTLMGRKCAFLQCSAGRWPKLCQSDNHSSAQHEDSFCSQISQGWALFSWTGFFLKLIDWKKKRKKVCFKGKVFSFLCVLWGLTSDALRFNLQYTPCLPKHPTMMHNVHADTPGPAGVWES